MVRAAGCRAGRFACSGLAGGNLSAFLQQLNEIAQVTTPGWNGCHLERVR
jgi:hypothetical protein